MSRIASRLLFILVHCSPILPVAADTRVSLGPSSGMLGEQLAVPLMVQSDEILGGLQLELQFDPTLIRFGTPATTVTEVPYRVDGEEVDNGHYRLLVSATTPSGLPTGDIVSLPATLLRNVPAESSAITLTEVIVANAYGLQRNYQLAPFIRLIQPLASELEPGQPFDIGATADFASGDIDRIDILVDGVLAGSLTPGSPSIQWAPPEPGPTRVVALSQLENGDSVESDSMVLQVAGQRLLNFADWRSYHFGDQADNEMVSSPLVDADGDRRWNIWEYAEGTNPMVSDQAPVDRRPFFVSDPSGRYLAIRMRRRIQTDDLSLGSLVRTDLSTPPVAGAATQLEEAGNFEIITFHTRLSTREAPTGFLQIEVDLDDPPPPDPEP